MHNEKNILENLKKGVILQINSYIHIHIHIYIYIYIYIYKHTHTLSSNVTQLKPGIPTEISWSENLKCFCQGTLKGEMKL